MNTSTCLRRGSRSGNYRAIKRPRRSISEVGRSQRAAREQEFKEAGRKYLGGSDDNIELVNLMDLIAGSLSAKAAKGKKALVKEVHRFLSDFEFSV